MRRFSDSVGFALYAVIAARAVALASLPFWKGCCPVASQRMSYKPDLANDANEAYAVIPTPANLRGLPVG